MNISLRGIAVRLLIIAAAAVLIVTSPGGLSAHPGCLMGESVAESEQAWAFRLKAYQIHKLQRFESAEERGRDLVEQVLAVQEGIRNQFSAKASPIPAATSLMGVEFYDEPSQVEGNPADKEIRILLDLPDTFIQSEEFDAYGMSKIGEEFLFALMEEPWNRVMLYARDPETGEAVDIQELLPKEEVPVWDPPVDEATVAMAKEQGKDPFRKLDSAARSQLPVIQSGPTGVPGALTGKTIFINQAHGWFDDVDFGRWRVQRGLAHGVNEDFDSNEFISLYVLPMLRNAGAKVMTVRESDHNTNMVIVDNDQSRNGANGTYFETGTWANSSVNGFVHRTGASWNGVSINPFNQGSGQNRLASGLTTSPTPTATATWIANIPEDGYYNVYASWAAFSGRASDAQYLVHHSGGTTEVRVDQTIDGYTWYLLGNWYFEANAPDSQRRVTLTNSSADAGAVNVSADAVRWGGGMGDMARHTHGISGRPRWEEEAVNYLQFNGFGYSGTLYSGNDDEAGGWSDRPQYARWEHSQKDGSVEDALYFAFHTNAFNGNARGLSTFRHSTATAASTTFQDIMHDTMYDHIEGQWFPGWTVRGKNTTNFGENNQNSLGTGLPGFLIEGLFHDNQTDAETYDEPKFRYDYARAILDGILNYFEDRDGGTLTRLPEPPQNFQIRMEGNNARLEWAAPLDSSNNQYFGDAATSYRVYRSSNGFGFDDGINVTETGYVANLPVFGESTYFRVSAVNAGGTSFPSETLGAASNVGSQVLVVNGFDRNQRSQLPQETVPNLGSGVRRSYPYAFQAFNYSVEHIEALAPLGLRVSSTSNEAFDIGSINIDTYDAIFWIGGEESTADQSMSPTEQARMNSYLSAAGNHLFISGSEIAWDLGRQGNSQDESFLNNTLRASYAGDDAGTYTVIPGLPGNDSIFAGMPAFDFSPAAGARYDAEFPDQLNRQNGSDTAFIYLGGTGGTAAISYDGPSKVVYLGFPFETIGSPITREDLMRRVVEFFGLALTLEGNGAVLR